MKSCDSSGTKRVVVMLLMSSLVPSVTCFLAGTCDSNRYLSWNQASTCISASSSTVDPASRFHDDMLRVLESRGNLSSMASLSLSNLERRQRPDVLSSDIDGAERVVSMLQHMVNIGVATEKSYQIALKALSERGRLRWRREDSSEIVCAADEVGPLIEELWEIQDGDVSIETCKLVLKTYAVCSTPRGNRMYAQKAQDLLERMEDSGIRITSEALSHVVNAWAWQQENKEAGTCASMAQQNFDRMLELSPDNETIMRGYEWLLEAWSKSSSFSSAEIAEDIFNKMITLKENGVGRMSAHDYSNVILAWTKHRGETSAAKAHSLLNQMLEDFENGGFKDFTEPELISFNGVIAAWSRCGRMDKAEEVLWLAEEMSSKCKTLSPDVVAFNSVLHGLIRIKDKNESLNKMLSIVDYMEKQAVEKPAMKPNEFTYNTLIKAWVQSGRNDAIEQAEQLMHRMRDVWGLSPSTRLYNVLINALAKSRTPDARKAYSLLLEMQASGSDACSPDIISYTSVIECYSKSTDSEAAVVGMELLEQANSLYQASGDESIMPNLRTYTMVIRAVSTDPTLQNIQTTRSLLDQLVELYAETQNTELRPNAFPYNYVLNCAANCVGTRQDKMKAFQIAAKTYIEMRKTEFIEPDSFTYAFWFKCCNNLLPDGNLRTRGLTYAFEQCKQDGLVSKEAMRRFLAGTPPNVVTSLLDIPSDTPPAAYRRYSVDDFPPSWSRNIR
eukprot:scaffold4829_cov129-Cylindrotheca_fusiformis.AAC.17